MLTKPSHGFCPTSDWNSSGSISIRRTVGIGVKDGIGRLSLLPRPFVLKSSRKLVKQESHGWPDRAETGFPSPPCASAIQIVPPLESKAETQPQLQTALLRLSSMIPGYDEP